MTEQLSRKVLILAAAEQRNKRVTHPERESTLPARIFVIHTLFTAQDNNNNNNINAAEPGLTDIELLCDLKCKKKKTLL